MAIRQTAGLKVPPHLARKPGGIFGTVIVTEHRDGTLANRRTTEVIDGQQRMTTTQVLALAFRDAVADLDDEFLRQCMDTYTGNAGTYRMPHARYKVLAHQCRAPGND